MSIHTRALLALAGLSLLGATIGGAAASHALAGLDERALDSFRIAVEFQFFHGLGLILVTSLAETTGSRAMRSAAWLFVAGTLLFCGSIYARTFGAPAVIGAAAPYGGIAFMVGWALFAWGACRLSRRSSGTGTPSP
jgi:uncharacterized membrane protein YgdD (TMEM256/DUF423 family)